jgi:hypothetical protein
MASSLTNVSQWLNGGARIVQQVQSTSGLPYGTAPSAGSIAGMTDLPGIQTANINFNEAEVLEIPGDDGIRGIIVFPNESLPTIDFEFADFTGSFFDSAQGLTADDAQSTYDFYLLGSKGVTLTDQFLMLTRRAVSTEAGSEGNGYETVIFPLCTITSNGVGSFSTGANSSPYSYRAVANRVSQFPWGEALSTGSHGADNAVGFLFWSEQVPTFDVFTQNNSDTTATPTKTLASNDQVIAWDDVAGTSSTLATTIDGSNDFSFTAQAENNVTVFLYERIAS